MKSEVLLMPTAFAILLSTPFSEGVKCYVCPVCKEKGFIDECKDGCSEAKIYRPGLSVFVKRDCRYYGEPMSGCRPVNSTSDESPEKGQKCFCNTDLCNVDLSVGTCTVRTNPRISCCGCGTS